MQCRFLMTLIGMNEHNILQELITVSGNPIYINVMGCQLSDIDV